MKYKPGLYLNSGYYEPDDTVIVNYKEKIVKCRKSHDCMGGCNIKIKSGYYAVLEAGFVDGKPMSCYTCLSCIEAWLAESGQIEEIERGE